MSGVISGKVSDPQGAVPVNASVTLKNLDLGLTRQTSTDAEGYYRVIGLPLGRYEVRAEHAGFAPATHTNVMLTVMQEAVADFTLSVRALTEEVTIKGDGTVINSPPPICPIWIVEDNTIRDLPLNGRDMAQLILLQPGVVWSRTSVSSANDGRGMRFSVAGSRPAQNLFIFDGTIVNDALNTTPGTAQGLLIGVETIKEFKVLTNSYGAEYGRAAGGIMVAVTKSGTNELHGSAFEFLRNDALDARNFFDRRKPEFRRNQFGFTLGGPVVRDRTFFFGSFEGLREAKGITRVAVVPDDQARLGRLPGQSPITVDARSQPIIDLFPRANGRVFGDGTAEFVGTTNRTSHDDFFTVRMDHVLSPNDSLSVRYLFDDSDQVLPRNFPEFPNQAVNRRQVATIEERKIFSATLVNEVRFGFNRSTPAELVPQTSRSLQLIAGRDLGEITVAGLSEIGTDRTNPKLFTANDFQISDDVSLVHQKHLLKFGGLFERFQYNGDSETRTRGQLRFRSLADLLRFRVQDLQGAASDSDFVRGYRQSLVGVYVQDDVRFNSRLTVNLGLRYETVTTPKEANDKVANLRNVLDAAVTVGDPLFRHSHKNFAPRVGFAADFLGDGKTAVRGGFGVYHDHPLFHIYRSPIFRTLPFVNRGRLTATSFSSLPVDSSLFRGVDQVTETMQFDLQPSYAMQYSLSLQRELTANTIVSLAYTGSRGINLTGNGDINTAVPQLLADGRAFFPAGSRRRNPSFDVIRGTFQGFSSTYHGLNLGVTKRLSRGLRFQTSYTWGKSIDDTPGTGRQAWSNGQGRTFDPYHRRLDRSRSNFDIEHSFTANATYDLPFGRSLTGWRGRLVGGWQLNTILFLYSGTAFTPVITGDPDRDATDENTARPDVVSGVSLTPPGGRTVDRWFNPAVFAPPQIGFRGTAGRNILTGPSFRSLDFSIVKNFHLSEQRSIQFRVEAFNLFNRANFDLPSNAEDGQQIFTFVPASGNTPAAFAPTPGVGRIFSTIGDSREIQLGVKLIF
jgi:hypothetical protein